jgi:thioredoxin 1
MLLNYLHNITTPWHKPCNCCQVMSNKAENMNVKRNGAPIALLREGNFEAEVLRSEQPVLVAFWAEWSRPCRVLDPILQELARAWVGKAKVLKVNADDCLDLSLCYDIQSIPTLLYFVEGRPRLRIVGTATKQAILAKVRPFGVTNETVALPEKGSGAPRPPGKEN